MSDFDVIIIGGGLAGSAAALKLAQCGAEVLVVERGQYAGSKNLSGGILYGRTLDQIVPNFRDRAPVERYIDRNVISFMTEDSSVDISYRSAEFSRQPYNGFSVLRAKFDRWLAEEAENAGAAYVCGIKVDSLIMEDGVVRGIVADGEEMTSDVVIAADGALSVFAEQAGLRGPLEPKNMAVGVKELIKLDKETVENRFNLTGNSGVAYGLVGFPTAGVPGGGFLYTNAESVSVGVVMHIDHASSSGVKPNEVLEDFLAHPSIEPLVRGGEVVEYGSHMVCEGGASAISKLYGNGIMVCGDAAGLGSNNGFAVRGMDYAIESGVKAAEAALIAKELGDYSAAVLSSYEESLKSSFVLKDMSSYAGAGPIMKNRDLYTTYPEFAASLFAAIYEQKSEPKQNVLPLAKQVMKSSDISPFKLAGFALKAVKNL